MQADQQVRDLHRSCLRLRDRLYFSPQQHSGEIYYHIENTANSKFFRVGYAQYVFISLLDGSTSFAAALALTARQLGPDSLTEQEATQLTQWLIRNELATFADETRRLASPKAISRSSEQLVQKLNPFWLKLPWGSPDKLFTESLPYVRWCFHPTVLLAILFVYLAAGLSLAHEWDRFTADSQAVFASSNWIWMLVTWVMLKIIHEFAHGVTCKYFGGSVKDTGLVFILLAPMAYVDVTSSWRFSSKWRRIGVAAAGMVIELLIASMAAIAWSRTDSPLVAHLLHNVVLMAGISTLLFNANPLMRFDGYFILSDFLEIPNLYEEGSKRVHQLTAWLFFGQSPQSLEVGFRRGQACFLWSYGLAASCWKLVVCATLLIGASTMFRGAGIVLGIAGALLWFGVPLRNGLRAIGSQYYESRPAFLRAGLMASIIGLALWSVWAVVPNPAALQVPCIVDYEQAAFVRASADGFLDEVLVTDGQRVEAGTPLLRLSNDALRVEVNRLVSDLKQSQQRARIARDRHEPTLVQIESERQRSIHQELRDRRAQVDAFMVVATRPGRVVTCDLSNRIGSYIRKGDELLVLGNDSQKELLISVSQDDIKSALPQIGDPVQVRIGSRAKIIGKLSRIEPRATRILPHQAFAATAGGPIAVKQTVDYRQDHRQSDEPGIEFADPRFTGLVAIAGDDAHLLFSGERGYAQIGRRSETLGRWAVGVVRDFVESRAGTTDSKNY